MFCWGVLVESLVWADVVVEVSVLVEALLGLWEVVPVVSIEQVMFEGFVESFVFALGLRMVGSAVYGVYA